MEFEKKMHTARKSHLACVREIKKLWQLFAGLCGSSHAPLYTRTPPHAPLQDHTHPSHAAHPVQVVAVRAPSDHDTAVLLPYDPHRCCG